MAWRTDAPHAHLLAVVLVVGAALRFYRITGLLAALYSDEPFYGALPVRRWGRGLGQSPVPVSVIGR
jgi:hypothetical protein